MHRWAQPAPSQRVPGLSFPLPTAGTFLQDCIQFLGAIVDHGVNPPHPAPLLRITSPVLLGEKQAQRKG